jgi:Highly conserved protein containing a thioredoxin domain
VDRDWKVPHFEKMLYDQALIALACLEAYQATGDPRYARTVREIFSYVLRDLLAESGGFYSGEDADSEGVEGKYYLWTWEELQRVLETEDLSLLARLYGLRKGGNLPQPIPGASAGANILYRAESLEAVAAEAGIPVEDLQSQMDRMHTILWEVRSHRIRPMKDTKILTDWNGLMIAALAIGGRVLNEAGYTRAARRAEEAIIGGMRRADGRLNHAYLSVENPIEAFSADYAALAWAEIELFQTTFEPAYLATARELMDTLAIWYRDGERGGYFFTASDGESLLIRRKEAYDGALPSANSLAVYNLFRLASLTGRDEYAERGLADWRAFAGAVEAAPQGYTFLLLSADYFLGPSRQVVIHGDPASSDTERMIRALASTFLPRLTVLLLSGKEGDQQLKELAPFLRPYPAPGENAEARVCYGSRCLPPVRKVAQMLRYLSAPRIDEWS